MAKREREPIRVEAYITVGGVETNVDALTKEQKAKLSGWLRVTYLNELFRGKAVFYTSEEGRADEKNTDTM